MKSEQKNAASSNLFRSLLFLAIVFAIFIPNLAPNRDDSSLRNAPVEKPAQTPSAFPKHLYDLNNRGFACQPKRVHIAQASNVDANNRISMTVSFSLDYANEACRNVQPAIVYGRGFFSKHTAFAGEPLQFNYTSAKSDGNFQSDYIYHVELPGLEAGLQLYWYRILVTQTDDYVVFTASTTTPRLLRGVVNKLRVGETDTYRFRTPPLPGSPTSIALVGDLGQTENSTRTMMHIWRASLDKTSNPISHLLIAGDMSYADSDPWRWISWFNLMEPLLHSTPVHVAAGNHEIECNNETNAVFVPYEKYFRNPNRIHEAEMQPITEDYRRTLPWNGSCSGPSEFQGHYNYGNSFYSYQHGLLHIIVLNSYTNSTEGSVQYEWLEEELQNRFDRQKTPWLIVSFHAPLYTTFLGHVNETEATNMKKAMEPLFVNYGVNLVVSGHDHAYMRTHSLAFNQKDPTGLAPVYLTLGAGGNREHHPPGYRQDEPEPWVAKRTLEDYGYGNLHVVNATHAHFNWVRDGVSEEGIQDLTWFINKHV